MSDLKIEDWIGEEVEEVSIEHLDQAVKDYVEAREDYDAKKKISNEADLVAKTKKKELYELLGRAGKKNWEVEGLGKVSRSEKMQYTTPKEISDKKALAQYIQEKYGKEQFWTLFSINSQTLNSFAKQELDLDPGAIIPGLDEPTARENISFRSKRYDRSNS